MARPSGAISAAVPGLLSWTVAYLLTFVLFTHSHDGAGPVVHLSHGADATLIASACCLATAVLSAAVTRVVLASARRRGARALDAVRPGSLSTVYGPAVFVAVEMVRHLVSGDEGTPVALLATGVLLHTATGALTPIVQTGFAGWTRSPVLALGPFAAAAADRPVAISWWDAARADSRPVTPLGGRGPPMWGRTTTACTGPA